VEGARRRSYRELDERATRLARALVALGLRPGERVAVVQANRIEYVETAIAIARAGGALVPLLGALTEGEHAFMVRDCEARFAVALTPQATPRARAAAEPSGAAVLALGSAEGATDWSALADGEPAQPLAFDRPPSSLAQILYTSGTTGHPKGVTHSYASVAGSASSRSLTSAGGRWTPAGSRARRS
jgi:acyl-CoA synthetase (AMP-forming)/AMP-acid ligase II